MKQVIITVCKYLVYGALVSSPLLLSARAEIPVIAQSPLSLGQTDVPGNLVLTPSVEYPTVLTFANNGAYDESKENVGYFDSGKCYQYNFDTDEDERHFYPVSTTSDYKCSGNNLWSGNFLNWATTQTIDPFRWALTGGYRYKDTPTETWLEKAKHTGQYNNISREISGMAIIRNATPFGLSSFTTNLGGHGNEMYFDIPGGSSDYRHVTNEDGVGDNTYAVTVRVKVCEPSVGVEDNCVKYGSNWKPEGLIQRYANQLRYSVFGYLNDHSHLRDGGVLRARQKWVGPIDPDAADLTNDYKEWDPDTGVFIKNPNPQDAADTNAYYGTNISDSGVINYLNKFGQLNDNWFKQFDPVSELYYTALRYMKNQGNVEAYYTKSPSHNPYPGDAVTQWVDDFPVIREWNDPIQSSCQKNVILGIGDIYTHKDKNLPGNGTNSVEEPAKPREVSADSSVDVRQLTDKVAQLESISINTGADYFNGNHNSAFMAGLAYHANTEDIRPERNLPGKQTIQTYWVDVLEYTVLQNRDKNQYWLAAKYGGFIPRKDPRCSDAGYISISNECDDEQELGDPNTRTSALPEWWWYTNSDVLNPGSGGAYKRTDNYYTASEARKMVDSLTAAFSSIANSVRGAASSLAANSARLEAGSALFNALMDTARWSGDLVAREITSSGELAQGNIWRAAVIMDALPESDLDNRKIFTSRYRAENSLTRITLNPGGTEFKWSGLVSSQRQLLRRASINNYRPLVSPAIGRQRLDFLRGSRTLEQTLTNTANLFRRRGSRLGDIVNSAPQFIHKKNFRFSTLGAPAFNANVGAAYKAYRTSNSYQNKPPIVLAGANDGMLHGFDARLDTTNGGKELFAFVPNGIFGRLFELTMPDYRHRYYVDGPAAVSDAWLDPDDVRGRVSGGWKTVAAVTPGAGGSGVSLLDISDPENMTKDHVLWEFSHNSMGAMIQKPSIVALHNGKFGVVVSSGFFADSSARDGSVWILNAANGEVIRRFTLPDAGGLGQPLVLDLNRNRLADRILVGDTLGNLWRIDINNEDINEWAPPGSLISSSEPVPFFVAKDEAGLRQPITSPLNAAVDSRGRLLVLFGTGSYYLTTDIEPTSQIQTFYGVADTGVPVNGRAQLLKQEVILEDTEAANSRRVVSDNALSLAHKGWFLDLVWSNARGGPGATGELINTQPVLRRGQQVLVATKIPSADPCDHDGGRSWLLALDYNSGGRLKHTVFDYNRDGRFTEADLANLPTDGGSRSEKVIASGYGNSGFIGVNSGSVLTGTESDDNSIDSENEQLRTVKVCLNNSRNEDIDCPTINAPASDGRKGWREVR